MKSSILILGLQAILVQACQKELREVHSHDFRNAQVLASRAIAEPPLLTEHERILVNSFESVAISQWSSYYAHGAHLAGRNRSMAQWTADRWTENGVPASLAEYEVLLSYPVSQSLSLHFANGTNHEVNLAEDVLPQDETTGYPNRIPTFHGHSATGKATAEYVYVGRAHKDDFARLVELGIQLEGRIALAKYGGPFRGLKVKNAQQHGMVGVVMFTDPGGDGNMTEAHGVKAYPDGPARNPSSVQRGVVVDQSKYNGDPTTPGYASKPGVPRTDGSAVLPKIPSIPISFREAVPLLAALDGHGIPGKNVSRSGWLGGLNVTYSTGPAPGAVLCLSNVMKKEIKPIWNAIGIINGSNADETIIIGNHRDAWIIGGASDPNSGSAVMVELSRALGKLRKSGWIPRRNIILCSWDAEEYGLVGSTEWVEEHTPWLSKTAISYINVDIAVSGPVPGADSSPELRSLALEVMSKVTYPSGSNTTLYDVWTSMNEDDLEGSGFGNLGSGSDYIGFLQVGIGAMDLGFYNGASDPVYHYHSNYDSYHWMSTYGDPGFKTHTSCGQYLSLLAYHLSSNTLIPFDLDTWGRHLNYWLRDSILRLVNTGPSSEWPARQQSLGVPALSDAISKFTKAAGELMNATRAGSFLDEKEAVEKVNGKFKAFQRVWVSQGGLFGREFFKNIAYAPDVNLGYAPQTFPGFVEAWAAGNMTLAAEAVEKLVNAVSMAVDILHS